MGFFDKVKNMFTEEVEDDVKVEQIKNDVTHVSIESPKAKDEIESASELNVYNFKEEIKKPVFFDDNDFEDLKLNSDKIIDKKIEKEKPKYNINIEEKEEKKVFKPTPIISPVYGVLDKNYHKEDIVSRTDVIERDKNIEPSIDSIRDKAYGTLEDELENTLFGKNSILFKSDEENLDMNKDLVEIGEDVLTNLTDDISKELDELLVRKEKYLDDVIEEQEESNMDDEDLLGFIDSTLYKEGDEE